MSRSRIDKQPIPASVVRCAIYTRKSTDEGLEQQFNTLDAQRDAAEAFVKSQAHECWEVLATRYDDGGYSGGTLERPALKRLLADIEAGKIDCVVVYKVDRLSRSLLDFSKLMETFEKHSVTFVSVTQLINTKHSMGRLMLNVLMSFAQFEREMISDRTRDKIAAARRKGLWCGGRPILGYDVLAEGSKLVINELEAERVRTIFALYLEHRSLITTIRLLDQRGWKNKAWESRKKVNLGGKPFNKSSLYNLLTSVTYIGKIRYKNEIHDGAHEGIVDPATFDQVQSLLVRNGRTGGAEVRNRFGALLKGILRCKSCQCAMTASHATKHRNLRYRYYVCGQASKRGYQACPNKSVPAVEIEQFVVDQLKAIGRDEPLIDQIALQVQEQSHSLLVDFETEQRMLERDLRQWHSEVTEVLKLNPDPSGSSGSHLADLQERIRLGQQRATVVSVELSKLYAYQVDRSQIAQAMAQFDEVWLMLTSREQARIIQLVVERVEYDGGQGKIAITFHALGLRSLTQELTSTKQELIA